MCNVFKQLMSQCKITFSAINITIFNLACPTQSAQNRGAAAYLVSDITLNKQYSGAAENRFGAFPQHWQVIELSYKNSLAYHYKGSTIKTLPATLPEPSSMNRRTRTGLLGVSLSALDLITGGGDPALIAPK